MTRLPRVRLGALLLVCGLGVAAPAVAAVPSTPPSPTGTPLAAPQTLVQIADPAIDESSGLVPDPTGRVLWTIQDASKPAEVYGVSTETGERRVTIKLPVPNLDWEDIDRGVDEQRRPSLFVADAGDRALFKPKGEPPRSEFALYRLREPALPTGAPVTVNATGLVRWRIKYEDGAARNSEAMAVQPGTNRIYLVNKNDESPGRPAPERAAVWVAPAKMSTTGVNLLTRVSAVPLAEATAAAFSPAGDLFVIRDYESAYLWKVQNGDVGSALREKPVQLVLPTQNQGESLTFSPDGSRMYIGHEGQNSTILEVPLPTAIDPTLALTDTSTAQASDEGIAWKYVLFVTGCVLGLAALGAASYLSVLRRQREEEQFTKPRGKGRRRA